MERVSLVALTALAWLGRSCFAILHQHLSFDPPFLDVDHWGKRTVGFEWDLSGATKTMKNFVRLTPDLQVCVCITVLCCAVLFGIFDVLMSWCCDVFLFLEKVAQGCSTEPEPWKTGSGNILYLQRAIHISMVGSFRPEFF